MIPDAASAVSSGKLLLPDLSEFQPNANMRGIADMNGGAAIVRLSYGTGHPDEPGKRMRRDADAEGYRFLGLYQYVVAGQDVRAQADEFCSLVGSLAAHEVPIADIEEGEGDQEPRAMTWLDRVQNHLGKRPWLYSYEVFVSTHRLVGLFNGTAYHTWIAAYRSTEPMLGHTLWQSTDGKNGVNITDWPGAGKCDTSVFHGTLEQLSMLVIPKQLERGKNLMDGSLSASEVAHLRGISVDEIWFATAEGMKATGLSSFGKRQAAYIRAANWQAKFHPGTYIWLP